MDEQLLKALADSYTLAATDLDDQSLRTFLLNQAQMCALLIPFAVYVERTKQFLDALLSLRPRRRREDRPPVQLRQVAEFQRREQQGL